MLTVPLILLGAAFCLAWAYALGRACLCRLAAPAEIALAVGAALESAFVFLLLSAGAASPAAFLGSGALCFALAWRFHGPLLKDPAVQPAPRAVHILCAAIGAAYGALYLGNALAPEIQGDAVTYHLGLAAAYARTGAFPDRVGFYEMVPQGIELLFTVAFSIGRHSAAKLVHFGFLLAAVPLLVRIGRRLGMSDTAALAAAGFYFCAPIAGICGTSAYNDAAMVFFILAAFYLLLVWRDLRDDRYLLPLGIAAGFCYAVKFSGIVVLPLAMLAALAISRRLRPLVLLAPGIAMIAPWMIRDAVLSGNPVAPLFNRWFPNPWFHAATEQLLSQLLGSYGVANRQIPFELAVGGRLHGIYGPLLFALPAGLLALRRVSGRWCWLAAAAMALPWIWNHDARFLMPAVIFAALALMMALPARAAAALLAVHAAAGWPAVIALYNPAHFFRIEEFPWRAALRLEPEDAYLTRQAERYPAARMIQTRTPPGARIFSLTWLPWAYTDRFVLEYWHSSQGDRMLDWLKAAALYSRDPVYNVRAAWPAQPLRALRFRLHGAHAKDWDLEEVQLWSGRERLRPASQWTLSGWPNDWEMTAAFDDNLATFWRTWMPMRAGMFVQLDFGRPQQMDGATLVSRAPRFGAPVEFYGMDAAGNWRSFGLGVPAERVWEDTRRPAIRAIRREGFQYILAAHTGDGLGPIGQALQGREEEWGLDKVDSSGETDLYRIR